MNWRLAGGWVLAVVLTTAVAWQIVAVADERVGDRPVSPVQAAPTTTTTIELSEATEPTFPPEPIPPRANDDLTTSTSTASKTSSTIEENGGPTTSSSATPSTSSTSTTSTTASAQWTTKTISTNGGTVVVSYRPGEVILEAAVPLPGFRTEIDKPGPPVVEVEFDSNSLRVDIQAEWEDGKLDIEVDEEPRED